MSASDETTPETETATDASARHEGERDASEADAGPDDAVVDDPADGDTDSDVDVASNTALEPASSAGPPSKALGLLGFLCVALLAVGSLFAYRSWSQRDVPERSASIGAKLVLAAGEVTLLPLEGETSSSTEAPERLLSGTPLPNGARLGTGEGARALVQLSDGSRVFLDESSAIGLAEAAGVEVLAGRAWLETPALDAKREPLIHRVGAATLALTEGGASLTLDADQQSATIYVAEGTATVTGPGGPKQVRSGERAVVGAGASDLPSVSPVAFWSDWTGGMAGRRGGGLFAGGSGALYAVDRSARAGTPSLPLSISSQIVDIALDGGLAETRVDQRFFNPSARDVEGWYWFTVPEGATLVGFALETDGRLVEGEIVEKKQAVATYERAVVSDDNPALLEWIDERTVRARVYPVPAMGERRVVVRYQQLLSETRGKLRYSYPLAGPAGREAPTIDEFSLAVELRGELASRYSVSTLDEATVSNGGELVTMRRTGFVPRADFELELRARGEAGAGAAGHADHGGAALRLSQFEGAEDHARFVMLRWLPDLDFGSLPPPRADVVIVVDTSAFGDDAEHQSRLAVAEALLRSLSSEDRFALMAADLSAEVLFPAEGLSPAGPEAIDDALAVLQSHRPGGATDLGAIFERALTRVHEAEQPAIVYVGDGLATSGERGADAIAERLRRALSGSRARLFAVGVGAAVDERLLGRLARVGGGESYRVETPDQAVVRALELSGALKTPTITELELELGEGLDDRFDNATGKLARGHELVVLARTHHELPETVTIRGRLGGEAFEKDYVVHRQRGPLDQVVPKLWAAARIERLLGDGRGSEAVRGKVLALGLEYGLMTPFTSFLALESERAYARQGVERRQRPWNFRLLGAALPTERPVTHERFEDSASPGELLLGAASAPFGCAQPDEDAMAREDYAAAPQVASARASGEATRSNSKSDEPMDAAKNMAAPDPEPVSEVAAAEVYDEEESAFDADEAPPAPPEAPGQYLPAASAPKKTREVDSSGYGGGAKGGRGKRGGRPSGDEAGGDGLADDPLGGLDPSEVAQAGEDYEQAPDEADFLDDLSPDSAEAVASVDQILGNERERGRKAEVGQDEGRQGRWGRDEDESQDRRRRPRQQLRRSTVTSPVARNQKRPCSDASARPLTQRMALWEQRLARTGDMVARLRAYENAAASCELENWKQQRVFLQMLQLQAGTEAEIELLLAHFNGEGEARSYLARALLRRLVEPALVGAVERSMFGGVLDWRAVAEAADRATSAGEALEAVELALTKHADASEDERLPLEIVRIDLLFELGRTPDAIVAARRLRDRGLITPMLAQRLGELLVAANEDEEARRVFSEIVEYDPTSTYTRRLLGDIFFRHGWFEAAYRQYQDLVEISGEPTDFIRLARAAAGTGRVDRGLRLLRQVASGDGRPGPDDPRRYARLHAAVMLAELIDAGEDREALERELERLALFDGGSAWTFVVWSDLEQDLSLGLPALAGEGEDAPSAEVLEARKAAALRTREGRAAGDTGLWAIQVSGLDELVVRHRAEVPNHGVEYVLVTIGWVGSGYRISREPGTIAAREARAAEPPALSASDGDAGDDQP